MFELAGIPVQQAMLGAYVHDGKEKVVVACKDFVPVGYALGDFIGVKNAAVESPRSGHDTELATIEDAIDAQGFVDRDELLAFFWGMFVVDMLIANNDRHNGNWGLLNNGYESHIAPVFDCGGCLFPDADENLMAAITNDPRQLDAYVFSKPTTAIKLNGEHLSYWDFIHKANRPGLDDAIRRVAPRFEAAEIANVVDGTPYISDVQKRFYKKILLARKTHLLDRRLEELS